MITKQGGRKYWEKKLDKLCSDLVRSNASWTCERCGGRYTPPTNALHCSHYFSRRYRGTRWDLDNLIALCYGCHKLWEGDKQGPYKAMMLDKLGFDGLEKLEMKAYAITKFSAIDLELLYYTLSKQYEQR